ncbi:MAG TPA: DNA replication and repair protein RecF [Longimicrobiales bacterium]|nr:DNA replication and repair protein RecF [Longimicrobiales bacterium]
MTSAIQQESAGTALVLRELRLRNFRNFAALDLQVPEAGAAIIGDNGSGKTNLLEAIHYLEIFRSFRGAADEQLVRFGAEAFHVRGVFEDRATRRSLEITAAYEPRTRRKRVTVDGVEAERLGDAIGRLGTVIFSPSDVDIVAGAPGERRRFLDIVLSLNVRGYLDALQRYRQVLRQRNAMLRDGRTGEALTAWDAGLIESGSTVIAARAAWVRSHAERFARIYDAIGAAGPAHLAYDSDVNREDGESHDAVAASFDARLQRVAQRERERGVTLAGPHRDDLALLMRSGDSDVDVRQYGSGGQVRTGAIALRMVEAETVRESRGFQPLLLLDDVFAELDVGRSRRILELFRGDRHGQVILTAPKESDVLVDEAGDDALVAPLAHWRIAAAEVFT